MVERGASRTVPKPAAGPGSELSVLQPASRISPVRGRAADDGRMHGQRDVVERRGPRRDGRAVVERVRPDPVLGDGRAQRVGPPHRRRAARRDDVDGKSGRRREGDRRTEERERVVGRRVREEAGEPQPPASRDGAGEQRRPLRRCDARASEARVAVDEDAELARPSHRRGQPAEQRLVVHAHRHRRPSRERTETLELLGADDVVRHEDVRDAGVGHHLGLAELLARDARGAERELSLRDLDASGAS